MRCPLPLPHALARSASFSRQARSLLALLCRWRTSVCRLPFLALLRDEACVMSCHVPCVMSCHVPC
eukprot:2585180-Rhodomonas_salina.1